MNIPFTDSIEQQTRNHQLDQSALNEAQQAAVQKIADLVDQMSADYRREKSQITSNPENNPLRQERMLAELRESMAARLSRIVDTEMKALGTRISELSVELTPQPPASDPALQFLIEKEIRQHLRDMDELQVRVLYEDIAITGKDDNTMRAIEGAPAAFPLITDPFILDAGRRARAARQSPESAKALQQLRQWQARLRDIVASAEAELDLPKDDPVAAIGRGKN